MKQPLAFEMILDELWLFIRAMGKISSVYNLDAIKHAMSNFRGTVTVVKNSKELVLGKISLGLQT